MSRWHTTLTTQNLLLMAHNHMGSALSEHVDGLNRPSGRSPAPSPASLLAKWRHAIKRIIMPESDPEAMPGRHRALWLLSYFFGKREVKTVKE